MHAATAAMSCRNCQDTSAEAGIANTFSICTFMVPNDTRGYLSSCSPKERRLTVNLLGAPSQRQRVLMPSALHCCHTRKEVCGMSMWVTPRCEKASTTALEKHGMPPTCGDSATPLAPSGWCGEGVTVKSVSHFGV